MSILGMGTLEILAVLLIAFIFLGPQRMIDAARLLGKATREARRMTEDLPKLTLDDEQTDPAERPSVDSGGGANPTVSATGPSPDESGPVGFKPLGSPATQDSTEEPEQKEKA